MEADRREIKRLIAQVAGSQMNTYDRASEVWTYSMGATGGEDWIYHPLWLLWGVLTDWVEVKPEETDEAEATMREAAQAFLPIAEEDDALRHYFDQWLYGSGAGFMRVPHRLPRILRSVGQRKVSAGRKKLGPGKSGPAECSGMTHEGVRLTVVRGHSGPLAQATVLALVVAPNRPAAKRSSCQERDARAVVAATNGVVRKIHLREVDADAD